MLIRFWQEHLRAAAHLGPAVDQGLPDLGPVEVGLGRVDVAADVGDHPVVLRDQGRGRSLVPGGEQLVERLGRAHYAVVPQVRGLQRGAAERRVEEVVDEAVVAAVDQHLGIRHAGLVGRGGLRGPAGGRVEQVGRCHVVARVLVNHVEAAHGRAGPARPQLAAGRGHLPGDPGGRDDQPPGAFQGEGGLEELRAVAERHLPEGRARFADGASGPGAARPASRRPGGGSRR